MRLALNVNQNPIKNTKLYLLTGSHISNNCSPNMINQTTKQIRKKKLFVFYLITIMLLFQSISSALIPVDKYLFAHHILWTCCRHHTSWIRCDLAAAA